MRFPEKGKQYVQILTISTRFQDMQGDFLMNIIQNRLLNLRMNGFGGRNLEEKRDLA
jgi:hypothetical protein